VHGWVHEVAGLSSERGREHGWPQEWGVKSLEGLEGLGMSEQKHLDRKFVSISIRHEHKEICG
jgi:hypothetical protein